MRRLLLTTLATLFAFVSYAQLGGDGYYRFQNFGSQRYLYVCDNRGSVSIGSTSADLRAILLYKNPVRMISDPSSVVYVTHVGGDDYRFHSQGTNSYTIVGYDLKIRLNKGGAFAGTYKAYQSKSGMTQLLCDERTNLNKDLGIMGTSASDDPANRKFNAWNIKPVTVQGDYFGIAPTVTVGNDYYAPFFAEFPFSFASLGMQAFYVKKVERGMAVIEEIKDNVKPGATPMIIKCTSQNTAENKLDILTGSPAAPSGNCLDAVYFCYPFAGNHENATPYNPETMRMLMVSAEGQLVFGKSDIVNLPANQAYLTVSAGSPDELLVVTQKQFDDIVASGIDEVIGLSMKDQRVFNMAGEVVANDCSAMNRLPAGVYVVGGKKYVVK